MSEPKRIIIEYEEGTHKEVSFGELSKETKMELSTWGRSEIHEPEKGTNYLILQWEDGWKEVVAVEGCIIDVLRYYTIERREEVGRLSLDMAEGYPFLVLVKRLPGKVEKVLVVSGDEQQTYKMGEKIAVREGGKIEHFFYDKKRKEFSLGDRSAAMDHYGSIIDGLKENLKKRDITLETLLAMEEKRRFELYFEFARNLGLRGMERQRDVYGFIQVLIERLVH